ncbi:MAG: efflux RND transporter periplasmic adaptor subunit [Bacteroidales bacterium]|nr:efflux RND transporter periplasmic adaptor subunit [Bacteroidales bacterium]
MKPLQFILIFSGTLTVLSCQPRKILDEETGGFIIVSSAQFENENMKLGRPEKRLFERVVNCRGYIVPSATGKAEINLPVPGIIHKINCYQGMYAEEGKVLFEVTGNEFIDLQKSYAEASTRLKQVKSEYERIKELYHEKIGAEKEYILAESEYKLALSEFLTLQMKITRMGLETSAIEEGHLYASYPLKSPIKGHITSCNLTLGQYAGQETTLLEVIDLNQLQLKLPVFAQDIKHLKAGQQIRFYRAGDTALINHAVLTVIGSSIDDISKSIYCFGKITKNNSENIINNEYVEAEIIVESDSAVAVPSDAVIKSDNDLYLLKLEKIEDGNYYFTRLKAETGRQHHNYTELINDSINNDILLSGAYNIVID